MVPSSDNREGILGRSPAGDSVTAKGIPSSPTILTYTPDNLKTKTLVSGLVVTTVDGMTEEKAQQTISSRILELNGTPFYIEEDGLVKEIRAVVEDGKILLDDKGNPKFEKIEIGKVGDKKFVTIKSENRSPASITDAADLRRYEDERQKERADYLKLMDLTGKALNRKK
jgi:hypothetical protein